MRRTLAPAAALAVAVLTGCGGDGTSDYCESVTEHQRELSDIAASSEPGAIFGALDAYRDLQALAPRDLRDEWSQVIGRLEALESALDEAGVAPAAYDPKSTLTSLPPGQRTAIQGAARDLGDEATVEAMAGIEQQALDVCKMPLSQ
jgi:hypothetical protein